MLSCAGGNGGGTGSGGNGGSGGGGGGGGSGGKGGHGPWRLLTVLFAALVAGALVIHLSTSANGRIARAALFRTEVIMEQGLDGV